MPRQSVQSVAYAYRHDLPEFLDQVEPATEVVHLDEHGVIVSFNDAWARFCEANGGRLSRVGVGVSYLEACRTSEGDNAADLVAAAVRMALTGDLPAPVTVSVPCHSPDTWRWFDVLVSSRRDDDGRCYGATVTISLARSVPISSHCEQRLTSGRPPTAGGGRLTALPGAGGPGFESQADRSERLGDDFAKVLFDLAPIGVLVIDDQDVILRVSRHGEAMFGYGHDGLAGVSVRRVLPGLPKRTFRRTDAGSSAREAIRTTNAREVVQGIRCDGSSIPLVASVGPVALSRGGGTVVLVHELSDVASAQIASLNDTIRCVTDDLEVVMDGLFSCGLKIASNLRRHPHDEELADRMGDALGDLDRAVQAIRVAAVRCLISDDAAPERSVPPT